MAVASGLIGGYGHFAAQFNLLSDGLVSFWRLEEKDGQTSFRDSLGTNDLTEGGAVTQATGADVTSHSAFGQTISGGGNYLEIVDGSQTGLEPGAGDFSIGGWLKTTGDGSGSNRSFISKYASDPQFSYTLLIGGSVAGANKVRFVWSDDGSAQDTYTTDSDTVTQNQWNHVVLVWDRSGTPAIYIDGVESASTIGGSVTDIKNSTAPFRLGERGTNDFPFDGVMDEVFYFDRALSVDDVSNIYQYGISDGPGSGLIGGYVRSVLGEVSDYVGAFVSGTPVPPASGLIGSYVQGMIESSGLIGSYIQGMFQGSGLIGGYTVGIDTASGVIGGFIRGGLTGVFDFDGDFEVEGYGASSFNSAISVQKDSAASFAGKIVIEQDEGVPLVDIVVPALEVSGLHTPVNQYFVGSGTGRQSKLITRATWDFGDFTPVVSTSASGADGDLYPALHRYATSGFYIATFRVIDSEGVSAAATRVVNLVSGVPPVYITLSGTPLIGEAPLSVTFTQTEEAIPVGVSITTSLLKFGNNRDTIKRNPIYSYQAPGLYRPIWVIRDSMGVVWTDSLEPGVQAGD